MADLAMHITETAKAAIAEALSSRDPGSVVALMYGGMETYGPDGALKNKKPYHWQFQVYPKAQAEALERDLRTRGIPFLYQVNGITLGIPQQQLVDQLKGRTLDVEAGVVVVK